LAISLRSARSLLIVGVLSLCAGTTFAAKLHRAILSKVTPTYPELARRMHVSGKVVLRVTIDADGRVSGTKVESGHALLVQAAQNAVSHWRFAPSTEASESEIDFNFNTNLQ
jgi:TonB family protein